MGIVERYLIALAIIFTVPWALWRFGRTDRWAPLVVVQILAGIVLGPGLLGRWFPEQHAFVLTPDVMQALSGLAWWAVMLFVMIAGIELDLRQAWRRRLESGVTAGLALGVPLLLGSAAAIPLVLTPGWMGAQALPWQFVLGVGMSCAVTALPILLLLMDKLELTRHPLGQRILRYASLDDLAIWAVLALIVMDWERVGRQAGFMLAFGVVTWAFRRLMVRASETDRWCLLPIWLAVCAFGADWAGLHFMVGAFLAGAVLDAEWFDQRRMDLLRSHVLLVLMPVFFLSTGLRTSWDTGGWDVAGAAALLLVASVVGKLAGVHAAGRLLGWGPGEASVIGWLLQTKALIMIVFANVLLDRHIITGATFTALLLMAVGSTMLTIPIVEPRLARLLGRATRSGHAAVDRNDLAGDVAGAVGGEKVH
ncbi:cation/H(+) antiporter [Melaminivora suipulveris]|uniref:Cation/H(+) antiporter n=1 Tax=Melaminivora suipulveris TaxID=2109913 RepID=A0A2R3QC07_9BURK|nr:cation:proton antiporter [Melaminivora suipulveris]AVO49301.1 cation/H(+) antiporter [Melaminivora suipulveris]